MSVHCSTGHLPESSSVSILCCVDYSMPISQNRESTHPLKAATSEDQSLWSGDNPRIWRVVTLHQRKHVLHGFRKQGVLSHCHQPKVVIGPLRLLGGLSSICSGSDGCQRGWGPDPITDRFVLDVHDNNRADLWHGEPRVDEPS
jgi:hypothetical protein